MLDSYRLIPSPSNIQLELPATILKPTAPYAKSTPCQIYIIETTSVFCSRNHLFLSRASSVERDLLNRPRTKVLLHTCRPRKGGPHVHVVSFPQLQADLRVDRGREEADLFRADFIPSQQRPLEEEH